MIGAAVLTFFCGFIYMFSTISLHFVFSSAGNFVFTASIHDIHSCIAVLMIFIWTRMLSDAVQISSVLASVSFVSLNNLSLTLLL